MNWLDTETKALLEKEKEPPLAPAKVPEFALVLGAGGQPERALLVRAVCRINESGRAAAVRLLERPPPVTVNLDLTEEDATLGQFELVCCGAVSAIVRSEIAGEGDREYLTGLLETVLRSPEFQPVTIWIDEVPGTEAGQRFADQFFGVDARTLRGSGLPRQFTMPAKKARIMKHWAERVGARVRGTEPGAAPNVGPTASSGPSEGGGGPPTAS